MSALNRSYKQMTTKTIFVVPLVWMCLHVCIRRQISKKNYSAQQTRNYFIDPTDHFQYKIHMEREMEADG